MISNKASEDPQGFDPEIREIEREIVKVFTEKAVEFTGRHPIIATVLTYFYTRRNLTQRDLQILTGFSAGTISKSVRQLVEMNLIAKGVIPGTHTHIYRMDGLPFTSSQYFMRTEILLGETEKELRRMKKTLDDNAEEMQNLDGFQKIYATVTYLMKLLPRILTFTTKIEEVLRSITKDI